MPANCSNDVEAVVEYVNGLFASNNETDIMEVLNISGLKDFYLHLDDVGDARGILFFLLPCFTSKRYSQGLHPIVER